MSGYSSQREVREVIEITLRMEGRNPADYSIAGIMRDAFYSRGAGWGWGAENEQTWRKAVTAHRKRRQPAGDIQRRRAECIIESRFGRCETCISTDSPGQPCDCQCRTCTAAQASTAPRFAITSSVHNWRWTYTNIKAREAQHIAEVLEAGSGETWTVTAIPSEPPGDDANPCSVPEADPR